eukprot:4071818-Ditylum_brightwellii.AAC.1
MQPTSNLQMPYTPTSSQEAPHRWILNSQANQFDLSPHLGGKGADTQKRVDTFPISSDESLYEFQSRSIQLFDKLNILQAISDTTTQINK